ncbi:MAG: hypothetical protein P9L94_18850 [Candidatus Hinthialibacter antarcticus]|nr:hypothetical protein [Candidatus Hinthialibacter antarcticus]
MSQDGVSGTQAVSQLVFSIGSRANGVKVAEGAVQPVAKAEASTPQPQQSAQNAPKGSDKIDLTA